LIAFANSLIELGARCEEMQ